MPSGLPRWKLAAVAERDSATGQPPEAQGPDPNQVLEELLRHLGPELAEALRLSAIPHGFDLDLLSALRGTAAQTPELLAAMQHLGLVAEIAPAHFALHSTVRSYLLGQAQRDPAGYGKANSRAATFFESRLHRGESQAIERDGAEQIFHLLAADEGRGLLRLRLAFEAAYGTRNLGLAEHLLDYAQEHEPILDDVSREWLRYFQAQLDQAFGPPGPSQAVFAALAASSRDLLLRGQATRSLAESFVAGRQWLAALDYLQAALHIFEGLGLSLEIARTESALGSAYVELAGATGGLHPEIAATAGRAWCWWHGLRHLPFLIYRWFSRRFSALPNLYFGTDYQNWLVIGYLYNAIGWFDRARATLAQGGVSDSPEVRLTRTHIEIRLAELWFRVERWSVAERLLANLAAAPAVTASPYLAALVRLGLGRSQLARGAVRVAQTGFEKCLDTFEQYGDRAAAANTHALLAEASLREGDRRAASEHFAAAAETSYQAGDLVNATGALAEARALVGEGDSAAPASRLAALEERVTRRAYVARFPGFLQRRYSRIAAYVALPLAYIFIGLFGINMVFSQLVRLVEFGIRSLPNHAARLAAIGDVFAALIMLLILFLAALWLYELVYVVAGLFVARRLRVPELVAEQPIYYMVDETGLSRFDDRGQLQCRLAWAEVCVAASFDRGFTRTPLPLFSRFLVRGATSEILIEGIVNRYVDLKRLVAGRLAEAAVPVKVQDFDYIVLDAPWALPALAAIFAIRIVNFFDWLDTTDPRWNVQVVRAPSGARHVLYLAGFLSGLLDWLVYAGPFAALIHLLHNRGRIHRAFPRLIMEPDWPIWLALAFFLVITLGKLYLLTE